jgi:hypothetical protein
MMTFMKNTVCSVLAVACLGISSQPANAQDQDFKYRRSSLSMILIESESFPNKDAVMASWNNYPFPEKYNKHDIQTRSFDVKDIKLTDEDLLKAGFLKDTLSGLLAITKATAALKPLRYLNSDNTVAVVLPTERQEYQLKIDKVIADQKVANQLVATWFNLGGDGKFDMSMVQERGFYNASEMEASIAKGQARSLAALGDAGEELIKNTFVTFTKLEFVENEPVARATRDAAKEEIAEKMKGKPQMMVNNAMKAADAAYEEAKEGYSLWSKTWLYQLNWNDSTAAVFYSDYWNNPSALENSDLFQLNFVGVQYNQSLVTFKIGEQRTQEQIIDLALVRNLDNAFAELQKDNDVFKPKVPIISINPVMAQIGQKESITADSEFEVLEMVWDSKTGKTAWTKIGKCKVDGKQPIWDNRYNAGEPVDSQTDASGKPINGTTLVGPKKIQPGMLIKQTK